MDFTIKLVNYVLNLPNGQVTSFGEFKSQDNCLNWASTYMYV